MTPDSPDTQLGELLVLLVDDNPRNLKLARDVLGVAGIRTIEAASGAEGLVLAAAHQPDVILMDLRLPDMDGVAVTRRLGEGERTARIPVVALSSVPRGSNGEWFRNAGFAGYLEKPFDVAEFANEVRSYARGRAT